jgi:hypothetical protein
MEEQLLSTIHTYIYVYQMVYMYIAYIYIFILGPNTGTTVDFISTI